jgi:hypothetical protein
MLGTLMAEYRELLDEKDTLSQQLKALNKRISALDYEILQALESSGVDHVADENISVTRKVELMPKIVDKLTFVKWCVENDMVDELIQKRCNQAPFRAYVAEYGECPPGTDGYTLAKLNVRRK